MYTGLPKTESTKNNVEYKIKSKPYNFKILKYGIKSTELKPLKQHFQQIPNLKVTDQHVPIIDSPLERSLVSEEIKSAHRQAWETPKSKQMYFYFKLVEVFEMLTQVDSSQIIFEATLEHLKDSPFQKTMNSIGKIANVLGAATNIAESGVNAFLGQGTGGQISIGIENLRKQLEPDFLKHKIQLQELSHIFYEGLDFDLPPESTKGQVFRNIRFVCRKLSEANTQIISAEIFLSLLIKHYAFFKAIETQQLWIDAAISVLQRGIIVQTYPNHDTIHNQNQLRLNQ